MALLLEQRTVEGREAGRAGGGRPLAAPPSHTDEVTSHSACSTRPCPACPLHSPPTIRAVSVACDDSSKFAVGPRVGRVDGSWQFLAVRCLSVPLAARSHRSHQILVYRPFTLHSTQEPTSAQLLRTRKHTPGCKLFTKAWYAGVAGRGGACFTCVAHHI